MMDNLDEMISGTSNLPLPASTTSTTTSTRDKRQRYIAGPPPPTPPPPPPRVNKNSLISKFKIQITGDTTSAPYNFEFLVYDCPAKTYIHRHRPDNYHHHHHANPGPGRQDVVAKYKNKNYTFVIVIVIRGGPGHDWLDQTFLCKTKNNTKPST